MNEPHEFHGINISVIAKSPQGVRSYAINLPIEHITREAQADIDQAILGIGRYFDWLVEEANK